MNSFLQDLRFAFRQLRRAPFFSLTVVGTLAISVGATAALSGVLRATLLNQLPYPHPDELVTVRDQNLNGFKTYGPEKGGWPHTQFAIRSTLPGSALEPAVRRMVKGLNGSATVGRFTPLASTVDGTLAQPRLNAGLLTAFAGLSLLLVVIGVYGLVAFDMTQRTRELGLRMALGSSRRGIVRMVLADSLRMLTAGLGLGFLGSVLAAKGLSALTYGRTASTPALLLSTAAVLALAVLSATFVPAQRAANTDPLNALRSE